VVVVVVVVVVNAIMLCLDFALIEQVAASHLALREGVSVSRCLE